MYRISVISKQIVLSSYKDLSVEYTRMFVKQICLFIYSFLFIDDDSSFMQLYRLYPHYNIVNIQEVLSNSIIFTTRRTPSIQ